MSDETLTLAACADDELVQRAQENDPAAFAELMRRNSAASLRLAMSILRDRQEAEDEVQNSYFNAWRHVRSFQREAKFSTWISRIVVNQCIMRLRKLRGSNFVYLDDTGSAEGTRPLELTDDRLTPEEHLGGKELMRVLQKEIRRLPPLLRHVLILRDVEELSTGEVARRLGISIPAVKSRLLRARSELRHCLKDHLAATADAPVTV